MEVNVLGPVIATQAFDRCSGPMRR